MHELILQGCMTRPLGSYLKALAVLRLVSEQADPEARGWWAGDLFHLACKLNEADLVQFFLDQYKPTPILGPWNGGSGFYEKDNKVGINAIAGSTSERFADYREAIAVLRALAEVAGGAFKDKHAEDERRGAILLKARNALPDSAVEWLDAAVGLAADGKRSFAPVVGTGGNEGRLDYTNNFMERVAGLLVAAEKNTPVEELLGNSLFGLRTAGLQAASVGQFDPGRAGGANQGEDIATEKMPVNPWDFVLTLEGAVAWASGLYRRQGISYRSFLCSPFTVRANSVGYGSAAQGDDARAEIWMPVWGRPTSYSELKVLLREGRASIEERPAATGIEFAEAACSLGVDRGIQAFVRYNLLKRRGDSYVALPAGQFTTGYRSVSDRIRELRPVLDSVDSVRKLPESAKSLRRRLDAAIYEALLHGGQERIREAMAALGRLLRWFPRTGTPVYVPAVLDAAQWIDECGSGTEVSIAAALASVRRMREHLLGKQGKQGWAGRDLPERMINVLESRARSIDAGEAQHNCFGAAFELDPGDATLFIEGSVSDELIEDLLFGFTSLDWRNFHAARRERSAEAMPVYLVLKHLFLPSAVSWGAEDKPVHGDGRVLSLLRADRVGEAACIALNRLQIAGLNPIEADYQGGVDALRLAASLLIPVRMGASATAMILNDRKETELYV